MKNHIVILWTFCLLILPPQATGEIYQYTNEQGVASFTDSASKIPSTQPSKKLRAGGWQDVYWWYRYQMENAEGSILEMSIPERLLIGIGLGFFGLVSLYVLLFKSSIPRFFPRILLQLGLMLIIITSASLSYFTLGRALIDNQGEEQTQSTESENITRVKERIDTIREIERFREKKFDEAAP